MMTIDLSNKMETSDYYHSTLSSPAIAAGLCQIDQNRQTTTMSLLDGISASSSSFSSNNQHGKESIHSGQFMVSHFEAEAQDDDDTEIKMPDPDDLNYEKPDDLNLCTEIQLYVPQKINQSGGSTTIITSHLEIETSLTKLFKCMNLAYRQKLTSPKWNHFKGVRLRWKDKIRLNNLIWRCWHMQFILKKKTPVCQFASPLDVDIHSNPQSVVLEGKYWKRQLSVIKAEYRKWRRNSKTKAIGCCFDTRSEFDFLDWSPLSNDRNLMITEDWTSDTLFSAINVPFPFPDPREIARGAGIADFIQPSLGPLQPNLEDIDITFQELLQNTRLPPVPEEGTDDILKNVDYNFPAIMGSEQLDSVNIMDVQTTNTPQSQQNIVDSSAIEDTTMVDINTTLNSLQYTTDKICSNNINAMQSSTSTSNILDAATASNLDNIMGYSETIMNDTSNSNDSAAATLNSFQMLANVSQLIDLQSGGMSATSSPSSSSQLNSTNSGKNNVLKGRVSKTFSRSFRKREPHNYDKAQPTLHQTNIYQQMLAEQKHQQTQQQQQCQLPTVLSSNLQFTNQHQFPSQNTITTNTTNSDIFPIQTPNNSNSGNNSNSSSTNNLNILPTMKSYSVPQATTHQNSTTQLISHHQKPLSASSEILSILHINDNATAVQDLYKATMHANNSATTSYKTFTNAQNIKKLTPSSSSSMNYINMLSSGSTANNNGGMSIKQLSPTSGLIDPSNNPQQDVPTKEMYRSNSLPLNSSLQKFEMMNKDEMFVMPKFHAKTNHNRSRTRSTSTHQPLSVPPSSSFPVTSVALQTATSEPLLNSTLAQLLTTNSTSSNKLSVKQSSAPATLIQNVIRMPTFATGATAMAYQQQQQNQTTQSQQQLTVNQLSLSPTRSTSLPQSANLHSPPTTTKMMSFPPCLSPDSFPDDSPLSPTKTGTTTLSSLKYMKDSQRRVGHIQAEQKRRYNIKNGFDMLHSLIPQLQQNPNAKLSKAAMLQKGAEYIKQLRIERNIINEKMDALKKERDNLNASLSHLHSVLPANGAPISRQRTERVKQLFSQYVRYRTMQNWKFWILGLILEPLLNSYTTSVSMASMEELYRTALLWVEQHCSLVELRPAVSNKLRYLSMTTDILSDPPSTLQEEVLKSINNTEGQHPNLSGT